MSSETLKKQLELVRFEKAIDYVRASHNGLKHLNAQELASVNKILTHKTDEPWREGPAVVKLPSGHTEHFNLISNPIFEARTIISKSLDLMENSSLTEGALHIYTQLVLKHLFKDANRRTAVIATYWALLQKGVDIPAMGLLKLGLGNLRLSGQLETIRGLIRHTIALSESKK